jgi:hypothetical protein
MAQRQQAVDQEDLLGEYAGDGHRHGGRRQAVTEERTPAVVAAARMVLAPLRVLGQELTAVIM